MRHLRKLGSGQKADLRHHHAQPGRKSEFACLGAAAPKAPWLSTAVFHHLLTDHFDKSSRIDWYSSDADDFRAAIKYAIIDEEDERVMWGRDKLKPLKKAIEAVSEFLETEEGCALALANPGKNWDADDLEFWEEHL